MHTGREHPVSKTRKQMRCLANRADGLSGVANADATLSHERQIRVAIVSSRVQVLKRRCKSVCNIRQCLAVRLSWLNVGSTMAVRRRDEMRGRTAVLYLALDPCLSRGRPR